MSMRLRGTHATSEDLRLWIHKIDNNGLLGRSTHGSINVDIQFSSESESITGFKEVSHLVSIIRKTTKTNVSEICKKIGETRFPFTKNGVRVILEQIFCAARLSPNKVEALYLLFIKLFVSASNENFYGRFPHLLKKIRETMMNDSSNLFLLILNSSELQFIEDKAIYIAECLKLTNNRKSIIKIKKNLRLKSQLENIIKTIHDDDDLKLQEISSNIDFDFNMKMEIMSRKKTEDQANFLNTPLEGHDFSLIDYAAFCGSIKCFKFLLSNQANLQTDDTTRNPLDHSHENSNHVDYAICGGNIEIIRIYQQRNHTFPNGLITAIYYHRKKIFNWIIENGFQKEIDNSSILADSIRSKFFGGIEYLIAKEEKISARIYNIHSEISNLGDYEGLKLVRNTIPFSDSVKIGGYLKKSAERHNCSMFKLYLSKKKDLLFDIEWGVVFRLICMDWSPSLTFALLDHKIVNRRCKCPNFLTRALESEDMDSASRLLDYDIDFNNQLDEHPLTYSVRNDSVDKVRFVLSIPGIDVNTTNMNYAPPICLALHNNNEEIIDLLLSREDLNINVNSNLGAPLSIALDHCSKDVVDRILSIEGLDANIESSNGSVLYFACKKGDFDLYQKLITRSGISYENSNRRSPFVAACSSGNIRIVKDIYERKKIDLNEGSIEGTALYAACKNNHLEIVRFLIDHGSDVNKGFNDISPLFVSCEKNNFDIFRLLITNDGINTRFPQPTQKEDQRNIINRGFRQKRGLGLGTRLGFGSGTTAIYGLGIRNIHELKNSALIKKEHMCLLSMAIQSKNKEMIDLILNSGKIKFTPEDVYASFSSACSICDCEMIERVLSFEQLSIPTDSNLLIQFIFEGRIEVVEILLRSEKFDVNKEFGGTNPILHAIKHSNHRLFSILVHHPLIDLNITEPENPLILACMSNKIEFVQALIESPSVNPNIISGRKNALLQAVAQNKTKIVSILLQHPSIDLNVHVATNMIFRNRHYVTTPLIEACRQENAIHVRMLCDHQGIDINSEASGENPLVVACQTENREIFDILINHQGIDVNSTGCNESPIGLAFASSNSYMIQRLMSFDNLDFNVNNETNPLISSVNRSKIEWIKKIISSPNIDPNFTINNYSALSHACKGRKAEIVRLLLQHPMIDVNQNKKNPLKLACKCGSAEIVSLLLLHPGVNVNSCNGVLHAAIRSRNIKIIRTLLDREDIDINQVHKRKTCLSYACSIGSIDTVNLLVYKTAIDVNLGEIHPLVSTCSSNSVDIFSLLLSHQSIDLSRCISRLLLAIISQELLEFAEILISSPSFISIIDPEVINQTICIINLDNHGEMNAQNIGVSRNIDLRRIQSQNPRAVIKIITLILSIPISFTSEALNNLVIIGIGLKNEHLVKEIISMESFDVDLLINSFRGFDNVLKRVKQLNNNEIMNFFFNIPNIDLRTSSDENSVTPLVYAIKNNDMSLFDILIKNRTIDVNTGNPLSEALSIQNDHFIEIIISHPDIKIAPEDVITICKSISLHEYLPKIFSAPLFDPKSLDANQCLCEVIKTNDVGSFHFLIDNLGIDKISAGCLNVACSKGNKEIIDRLLCCKEIEISIDSLIYSITRESISNVQKLISIGGFDINTNNSEGISPLKCAIMIKNISILEVVYMVPGIDINFSDTKRKKSEFCTDVSNKYEIISPLALAIQQENNEAVDLLLNNSAIIIDGVDCVNIYEAAINSPPYHRYVEKIINCKYFDARRSGFLSFACLSKRVDIVDQLLSIEGIDINYSNTHLYPPIVSAIKIESIDLVKRLISIPGIKVNFEEASESPLFFASKSKNIEIINLLLEFPGIDKSFLSEIQRKNQSSPGMPHCATFPWQFLKGHA